MSFYNFSIVFFMIFTTCFMRMAYMINLSKEAHDKKKPELNLLLFFAVVNYFFYIVLYNLDMYLTRTYINIINHENNTAFNELERIRKLYSKYDIPFHVKKLYVENMLNNNFDCSICLTTIYKNEFVFLTKCGHLFHTKCIYRSYEFSNKCPNCRNIINVDTTIPILLEDNESSNNESFDNESSNNQSSDSEYYSESDLS